MSWYVMLSSSPNRVTVVVALRNAASHTKHQFNYILFNLRPEILTLWLHYYCRNVLACTIVYHLSTAPTRRFMRGQGHSRSKCANFLSVLLCSQQGRSAIQQASAESLASTAVNPGSSFHIFRSINNINISSIDFRHSNSQSNQSQVPLYHRFTIDSP